ncbi:hypothetical protein RDABS01_012251, partial [Bienertia sinuspersici]
VNRGGQGKPFRFEALWLSSAECEKVVSEAWARCAGETVANRLGGCAEKLSGWAAGCFGDIKKRKKAVEEKLKIAQRCGWHGPTLWLLFSEEVCAKILQIPLSLSFTDDCLFWWPAKNGEYSVKSGYWLGRMGRHRVEVDELDEDSKDTWRIVWGLGDPPKLSHFLWQACKGSMAVREVLAKRHIAIDMVCGCCEQDSESAATTWNGSEFAALVREAPDSSFGARLHWLDGKISSTQLQKIMAITWANWFCRNKWLYEQQDLNGTVVAARFVHMVEEFGNYVTQVHGSPPVAQPATVGSWIAPHVGFHKVNTDAHTSGSPTSVGVVVRDDRGAIVLKVTRLFEGGMEAEVAEALAARVGLEVARRFSLNKVWLESDSLNVVKKVNTKAMGFSPLFLVINDIVELSNSFHTFSFSHVRRAGNTVAHLAARGDTKGSSELVCMAPFPQSIAALADLDLQ